MATESKPPVIAYRISEEGEQTLIETDLGEGLMTYLGDTPHSVGRKVTVEIIATTQEALDALPEWQS